MAVFRVEKTKDFTVMSNHHLRNTELSLKAKGLLSLMLSLPEDWDYTTKGLAHICRDGVDSITTALKELERHGYLTRQRLRNENGQLGDIEYTIHEKPVTGVKQGVSPKRENPRQVNPRQAKPEQAEPEQENPAQLNTNPQKTKKSKTDISRTHQSIYPEEPETAGCQDGIDRMDMAEAYRGIIKENIEYAVAAETERSPVCFYSMEDMMDEIMFSSKPENLFECTEPLDAATMPMYVLTNASKVNGSGILARDGVLDKIGELLGKNFYVLPSSIHEVLIVPDNGDMQAKELESMVKEVNATQVAPADLLSDKVQYYDRAAKTLGRKQEKGLLERLAENKAQVKEQAEKAPKEKTAAKQEPSL